MDIPSDLCEFDVQVHETRLLSAQEREQFLMLFESNYRQANASYLDRSLLTLRYAAMAVHNDVVVGFALGETREMALPRLSPHTVSLAGIACVAPEHRRRGLFSELARLAITAGPISGGPRRLVCGRMAHPAALRTIARLPTVVPRPGLRPNAWQQEVGQTIAAVYGVHDFDPTTFVCIGDGIPIGYPRIELQVEPHEWDLFQPVNRDRGDALLAIAWYPDAPPEW